MNLLATFLLFVCLFVFGYESWDLSFPTRDPTYIPNIERQSLNCLTARVQACISIRYLATDLQGDFRLLIVSSVKMGNNNTYLKILDIGVSTQ